MPPARAEPPPAGRLEAKHEETAPDGDATPQAVEPEGAGPQPGAEAGEVEKEPGVYVAGPPDRAPAAHARPAPPRRAEAPPGVGLEAPITRIPGINVAYAKKLEKLGVKVIRDLLYLFPHRYDDFSALKTINQLQPGEEVTIVGTIWQTNNHDTRRGMVVTETVLSDGTGTIKTTWFNQPYLAQQLKPGRQIVVSGKVDLYMGRLVFQSPEWELLERELIHTARIVPVYPLTEGLGAKWMRRLMRRTVEAWAPRVPDPVPAQVRERWHLCDLPRALEQIHFPDSWDALGEARHRLSFDEFLLIQLGVLRQRRMWRVQEGPALRVDRPSLDAFLGTLPFALTGAQQRVLDEILGDIQQPRPMSRLLQGDVGSGKTVVAAAAMLTAVANDAQAVLMAPTEILAEQHYRTLSRLLGGQARTAADPAGEGPTFPQAGSFREGEPAEGAAPTEGEGPAFPTAGSFREGEPAQGAASAEGESPVVPKAESFREGESRDGEDEHAATAPAPAAQPLARVAMLTGSMKESEKAAVRQAIAAGEVDIVVGTHALIQEGVEFANLALAVIDEQHRFGVAQRASLRGKGQAPHILVMTATPIPRTLALTIYGDLDVSVIDELPPGRQEIKTKWLAPRERERAYAFVRRQVEGGRQAFIICPLIEESEKVEAKAAVAEYERLQRDVFPDLKLGLLHGKMRPEEKDQVMEQFYRGGLNILVSTAVVEVGIDVPNATVMLIEGANRFGLSQLHQFRGRVGRGEHQSYCLLVADTVSQEAEARLAAVEATRDGFQLAEEDLKLRGPGEFFGTRQSGLPELKVARISDMAVLEQARTAAQEISERDPELSHSEHHLLSQNVNRFWRAKGDLS